MIATLVRGPDGDHIVAPVVHGTDETLLMGRETSEDIRLRGVVNVGAPVLWDYSPERFAELERLLSEWSFALDAPLRGL